MNSSQKTLSRRYFLYRAFTSMWFTGAAWIFFYRLFMSDTQIGILDAIAFAIALVAEVPSGALADRFGRDRMTRLGQGMVGVGLVIQGFSHSFVGILIGQIIFMVGTSFASGADEALFFEKLDFKGDTSDWRKLVTRGSQVGLAASLGAYLIGGFMYTIAPGSILIGTGIAFLAAVIVVFPLRENRGGRHRKKLSVGEIFHIYTGDISAGFLQFMTPKLRMYLPLIIAVQGLFYTCGYGLLRPILLSRFGFDAASGGIVLTICGIVTILVQGYLHKHAGRAREKEVFTLLTMLVLATLLMSVMPIGYWGLLIVLVLYAGEHIMYAFMSEVLNKNTSNDIRATVLSVASFFKALPYVALAPLIGALNTMGHLEYFLIGWSALVLLALVYYLADKKKDSQLALSELIET